MHKWKPSVNKTFTKKPQFFKNGKSSATFISNELYNHCYSLITNELLTLGILISCTERNKTGKRTVSILVETRGPEKLVWLSCISWKERVSRPKPNNSRSSSAILQPTIPIGFVNAPGELVHSICIDRQEDDLGN
jgi:hypothetical protein